MAESFLAPVLRDDDGFVLRPYQPGDGVALREATTESYEHLRPWMLWASPEQSVDEAEATCRRLASTYLLGTDFPLGVWAESRLLGGTGFHLRCGPLAWKCAEIGMWIRQSEAGSGLGTRVLAAMLHWGFSEHWGWERLIWKCDTSNAASARVAEKNGMTLEATHRSDALAVTGDRRDTHLYVMLKETYQARRSPD